MIDRFGYKGFFVQSKTWCIPAESQCNRTSIGTILHAKVHFYRVTCIFITVWVRANYYANKTNPSPHTNTY